MADLALLEAMGSMKIERRDSPMIPNQDANRHILSFEYPAFAILQLNETPKLEAPAKVEHRSKPPVDSRELALYDTNFVVALPLYKIILSTATQKTEHMRLFAAVEALKGEAGTTKIGVVRVHNEIWDEMLYRVRLETRSIGPFLGVFPQDFELNETEWKQLLEYAYARSWIGVLGHLVTRASAKAYYHVRQRIGAKYGSDGVEQEEGSWTKAWGTKPNMNAAELYLFRLTAVLENLGTGRFPELMLECGHGSPLTGMQASGIHSTDVWNDVCKRCNVRNLKPEDDAYVAAVAEKKATKTFWKMQRVWANLVHFVSEPNQPRKYHSMSIFRVLVAALESLKSTESVMPVATCPSTFEETTLVLEHLEEIFCWADRRYELTAEELLDNLEQEALGVRIEDKPLSETMNPPGFDDFLARWLRRAAYFLAYRRCDGRDGKKCSGLHWHRDRVLRREGLWYAPEAWLTIEELEDEVPAAPFGMKDVMKALDEIVEDGAVE